MTPRPDERTLRGRRRRKYITWRLVVNSYPCEECHVPPGRACITMTGNPKPEPHAARTAAAHARGWAFADAPARCVDCNGPLPGDNPDSPQRCRKCARIAAGPPPVHATREHPGPDGSYDVPLWGP